MAMYKYNGVVLPALPASAAHMLIFENGDYYYLVCSSSPFYLCAEGIVQKNGASATGYATMDNATIWVEATISQEGDENAAWLTQWRE